MRKLFILALACLMCLPAQARFKMIRRNSLQKLENATIYSIVSDQTDALWISSNQGLLRYNGSFLHKLEDPLPMQDLCFDGENRLYAIARNYILSYDTSVLEASRIGLPESAQGAGIICAGKNGLWYASGPCLWYCPKGEDHLTLIMRMPDNQDIDALQTDADSRPWIASGTSVYMLDGTASRPVFSIYSRARSLFFGQDGNLWVGYKTGGVASYNRQFTLIRNYELNGNNFRTFCQADNGIYIGSESELTFIDNSGEVWSPPVGTLEHQPVTSLAGSRNGFLWAGTFYSGIYRILSKDGPVQNISYPEKLHNFRALARAAGNDLVALTDGNGAWIYNKEGFRLIQNTENIKFQSGTYIPQYRAFLAGIHEGGVQLLSQDGFTTPLPILNDSYLPECSVNVILFRDGKLWCATGDGIFLLERKAGGWEQTLHSEKGSRFYSMSFDAQGNIWAAGEGLYQFKPDNGGTLVKQGTFTSLFCAQDCVWASEFGKGVWQIGDGWSKIWNSENCGLEDNSVTSIYPLAPESILLTTRSGFSILDTAHGTCRNFDKENGLEMSSARNGAVLRMEDGRILICGLDGAAILDPEKLSPEVSEAAPAIDFIHLQDRDIYARSRKPLKLAHDNNTLHLEFGNFDYKEGANGSFEYTFSPYGDKWQKANLSNTLSMVKLHPGKYVIRSRYPGSDTISSFRFRVLPAWYASLPALFLYIIIIIGSGLYFSHLRYSRLLLGQRLKEKEQENEKWQKLILKLSHELRTPITTISGNLETYLQNYGESQAGIRYLHKAWNGTVDMDKVLSQLLEIEDTDLIKFDDLPSYGTVPPIQFIPKAHTLLIADDNPDILVMLEDIFSEEYTLLLAKNGTEALEMAVKSQPDLIISDIMMPGMNGLELCAALRQDYATRHIPIILLTAHAAERNLIEGLNAGADDYVAKPFSVEILRAKCRSLIRARETLKDRVTPVTRNKPTPFLNTAISAVEQHLYDADLSVSTLCRELNVSKTTLNRKLEELTGMSPRDFIEDIKLKYAATMLLKENSRVSEIADRLNFSSQKYFTLRFKKKFGKTPSAYVKEQS